MLKNVLFVYTWKSASLAMRIAETAWSNTPSLLTDSSCRSRSPSMCTIQAKFFDGVNLCRCLDSSTAFVHSTMNFFRLTSSVTIS